MIAKRGRKPEKAAAVVGLGASWAAPGHLSGEALAAWNHVVGLLEAAGNLDRTDPVLVETYAMNVAMLRQAQAAVEMDGPTLSTERGSIMANPACAILNAASMRIKAIVTDLGLCPAASKKAAGKAAETKSRWAGLIGVKAS
jgi:P27 family predicted phage terminase small subunit